MFSRFDTVPACDGRTDGRTDRRTSILYLLRASAELTHVKMLTERLTGIDTADYVLPRTRTSHQVWRTWFPVLWSCRLEQSADLHDITDTHAYIEEMA